VVRTWELKHETRHQATAGDDSSRLRRFSKSLKQLCMDTLDPSVVSWSEILATDPQVCVRFPALPDFLRSSGSGKGPTQTRVYN
jgi:hypothetical protein